MRPHEYADGNRDTLSVFRIDFPVTIRQEDGSESLTHDSIIVQIPRFHGKINNRLDRVLSIFDQTQRDKEDNRLLKLDENVYQDDAEMERILHRLTMAAAVLGLRERAASFRDRIVHHFLYRYLMPIFEPTFIYDSYSCRVGKGTLFGINRMEHHIRSVSRNYTQPIGLSAIYLPQVAVESIYSAGA